MFCMNHIRKQSVYRLSRRCIDWSHGIPTSRACTRFSKNVELNKGDESDSGTERKLDVNNEHKVSSVPLALRYFTEDVKTTQTTPRGPQMFEKSMEELNETLEDIKFDIENMRSLKREFEAKQMEEKEESVNELLPMSMLVGTPDRLHIPSTVPCGGCGSLLHCNDSSIPGYIPQEHFKGKTKAMLSTMFCQRCRLLRKGEIIKLDIDKHGYKNVVKQIKKEIALVIMVVDVTDMANSVIPEFLNSVGRKRPIFIVGNKVDLLPRDEQGHLNRIMERLNMECERASLNPVKTNIRYMGLVSAKTGYGIEELINRLISLWGVNGHVYLVGTTNSGKSTLFNRFLNSDYCKHTCRDIAQRATASIWPGTTLSLIQFPIFKPHGWKLRLRTLRLKEDQNKDGHKHLARQAKLKKFGRSRDARLFGTVGMTEFRQAHQVESENKKYEISGQHFTTISMNTDGSSLAAEGIHKSNVLDDRQTLLHEMYPHAKWARDTPGLVNQNQVINYLTAEELKLLLYRDMIRPRVFVLHPGHVMFITGLARIDYLEGSERTFFTVHTNHFLPVHIVHDTEADDFYLDNINTETLAVPTGSTDRLNHLPSLCGREFHIQTEDQSYAAADLQLSSLGWVSFAGKDKSIYIRAYTPGGRGMYLRTPALLPHIKAFKGKRISDTNKGYYMKKLER